MKQQDYQDFGRAVADCDRINHERSEQIELYDRHLRCARLAKATVGFKIASSQLLAKLYELQSETDCAEISRIEDQLKGVYVLLSELKVSSIEDL